MEQQNNNKIIPFKNGVHDCDKEHYWGNDHLIKVPCGECQSCKDRQTSKDIESNHIPGKFCKRANNCRKCSRIKYLLRVIKHISGKAKCTRKCEWCTQFHYQKPPSPEQVFKQLYLLMFFGETFKPKI